MSRALAIALLMFVFSLAAADDLSRTKKIRMDHYSVAVPATNEWDAKTDKDSQTVQISKADRSTGTAEFVVIVPHDISKTYGTVHTEEWLGKDILRREHANMVAMGVLPGLYELENVQKFEAGIGGKDGYAMTYRKHVLDSYTEHGYLFVYFPPDFRKTGIGYKFLHSWVGEPEPDQDADLTVFNFVIEHFRRR